MLALIIKVESIAECSSWSILQYFWPSLRDNWFFEKVNFEKKSVDYNKSMKNYPACKELMHKMTEKAFPLNL